MSNSTKEWEQECDALIASYPAMSEFLETWEASSGGKFAFRGQLCVMVLAILKETPLKPMEVLQALCSTIEEDFLLALRFLYYVKAKPVISDAMYDEAEKDFLARPEVEESALMNPGSDNEKDYPDHVKALAFYLSMMGWQRGQEAGKAQEAVKTPPDRPVATSKAKSKGKTAEYVEAPYVGDLFSDEMFPK